MPIQDDRRENEIRELFKLTKLGGRGDVDAVLEVGGEQLQFELKSTTKNSVSTVRDLGPDHIKKWRSMHWIVGVYDAEGRRLKTCYYASPNQMRTWVDEIEAYIGPDFRLAETVPKLVDTEVMKTVLGVKPLYALEDASRLQKKQHTKDEYLKMMDRKNGYSPERMLEILRSRTRYIIERGSTLNNPHISLAYFERCTEVRANHAARLRELVRKP